uniref:Uncharacterized protein n=1 Tax=Glossina austeni TaxID=7395 RepID=A0A1A9VTT7_GLOAU
MLNKIDVSKATNVIISAISERTYFQFSSLAYFFKSREKQRDKLVGYTPKGGMFFWHLLHNKFVISQFNQLNKTENKFTEFRDLFKSASKENCVTQSILDSIFSIDYIVGICRRCFYFSTTEFAKKKNKTKNLALSLNLLLSALSTSSSTQKFNNFVAAK